MSTVAPIRSSQLERALAAGDLVGREVRYVGHVGSAYGQPFTVTAAYDGRVTLTEAGTNRPALSFVKLSAIEVLR